MWNSCRMLRKQDYITCLKTVFFKSETDIMICNLQKYEFAFPRILSKNTRIRETAFKPILVCNVCVVLEENILKKIVLDCRRDNLAF